MKYQLQVLSLPTPNTAPSIVIRFDSAHYLINCGEGTQRLASEFQLRIIRLKAIFLNRVQWDCIGGLPGNNNFIFC
jgi:ribonuclease Z